MEKLQKIFKDKKLKLIFTQVKDTGKNETREIEKLDITERAIKIQIDDVGKKKEIEFYKSDIKEINKEDGYIHFHPEFYIEWEEYPDPMTVVEATEYTGISERGIRWNCKSGKYKCRKAGKVWLIERESLRED